jgi:hypothetical protein
MSNRFGIMHKAESPHCVGFPRLSKSGDSQNSNTNLENITMPSPVQIGMAILSWT